MESGDLSTFHLVVAMPLAACALFSACATAPAATATQPTTTTTAGDVAGASGAALKTAAAGPVAAGAGPTAKNAAGQGASGAPIDVTETDSVERNGLGELDKVVVRLSRAEVSLVTGREYRKGLLKVERVDGSPACKVRVAMGAGTIEIADAPSNLDKLVATRARSAVPAASGCDFSVTIGLSEAVEASVDVVKGSVDVEAWDEPLKISVSWGDVDVGSVGPLDVTCARCTLTGEGINGDLRYSLDSGNVGLAGLTGSVDGRTLGDTILKWNRLRGDASVRIVSHAGDVMLFFPESSPLAIDLHAPHGDVSSRFEAGSRGVPVSVTAELGNVQVFRIGRAVKAGRSVRAKKGS